MANINYHVCSGNFPGQDNQGNKRSTKVGKHRSQGDLGGVKRYNIEPDYMYWD